MSNKQRNPKVKMPSLYKIMNMLDPSLRGKTDRTFLKTMTRAIYDSEYNKKFDHKQSTDKH